MTTDAQGDVSVSYRNATGALSFVRAGKDGNLYPAGAGESAEAQAMGFLADYGAAFGITDAGAQLISSGSTVDSTGATRLSYTQVHQGVPVFGSYLHLRVAADGAMTAVNAVTVPGIKVSAVPALSPEKAGSIALDAAGGVERGAVSLDLQVQAIQLLVLREGLVRDVPAGADHLVYEVEVGNGSSVREFIYVDAHSGAIVDRIDAIQDGQEAPQALSRQISESNLANVKWTNPPDPDPIPLNWAGGTPQQVTDWNNEADGAKESYNIYGSTAGWDSYNNAGAMMRTVNNDPGIACPNANWNGTSTNYCTGVTADDVVSHEWGHAYTEYTSDLIYQWQSGAMNEAYSDIWGETVDQLNGRGTDTPGGPRSSNGATCSTFGAGSPSGDATYRWLMGEDATAFSGAIRDMWRPECYGDPGKVSSTSYYCGTGDGGGVHTNSGVPNHTYALLADGGTYNGQTVTGIGLTKAAHIFWQAQYVYLGPASNFADLANALQASCTDLTGLNLSALSTSSPTQTPSGQIITAADCQEVADAVAATQLSTPPTQCNFQPLLDPNAPALCAGQGNGTVLPIATEDWEGGVMPAGWTVGTYGVANPATFDTPDWAVVSGLPAGANGAYSAFVADLTGGDCVADDESGALYLQSPAIAIPAGAIVPRVAFDHWVATELGWDGGNVKVSVNGGPFTLLPAAAFEFNDYNQNLNSVGAGNTNPMAGQPAFTGTDGGQVGGSWGQSQVNLSGIAGPGDSVVFRIDFGVDGCNGVVGWYVDDVQVYSCQGEGGGGQCGNSVLDPGEQCDDGNTNNGDGCSDTCQVEDGWTCTDPTSGGNAVADGGFEAGTPNPFWTEASTNFGTPLCDVAGCGTGTGTGPYAGAWWAWFGGIAAYEEGSVSQSVTIPASATNMTFELEQIVCDSPLDYVEVLIDGNQEFVSTGASALCGILGYSQQTVDVSAYADDGAHTVEFHSEIFAVNGGGSNFFVDEVEIPGGQPIPSICTPIGGGRCGAGYQEVTVLTEGFDGAFPPAGWALSNTTTGCSGIPDWTNTDPGSRGNLTGGTGMFAIADSDACGSGNVMNAQMWTSVMDLTGLTDPMVSYYTDYNDISSASDVADLDFSTDGGATWTNLLSWNDDHRGPLLVEQPFAADGQANTLVRWNYKNATWDWWWQVDDVAVTACEPVATGPLVCNGEPEGFENGVPPTGWSVETNEPNGPQWSDLAGCGESGNFTNGSGDVACVSSDVFGSAEFDTSLVTPMFDLTGYGAASLDYTANYQNFASSDFLDVDISTDGGATWTNLLSWNEDHGGFRAQPGEDVSIDLSAYAGQSGLMLRYRYYDPNSGDWDWYAQIDNVALDCSAGGDDPNIDVSPLSMSSTQATNTSTNQLLNIANTGGGTLNWDIDEENLPGPDLILPTQSSSNHSNMDLKPASQPVTIGDNMLAAAGTGIGQTATPSRPATPDGLVTITHSASQTITALNSVSCNAGGLHTDNSYMRVFDLAAFGLAGGLDVTNVEFGIEQALGATGSQPVTVNLYVKTNPAAPLTFGNLTPIGTAAVNVSDQSLTILSVPVAGTAGPGSVLVVEVFTPNGQAAGNSFFIGSNALGQTAPSYLAAADCGVPEPTDTAAIGFPGMHIVMNVTGDADVTPPACTALADIPWLSLSAVNGSNAGGTDSDVTVTFDSNALANGTYTGNLCITSNDPDPGPGNGTDLVVVPVTLTVQPPTAVALTGLSAGVEQMPAPAGVPLGAVAAAGLSMALAAGYTLRRRRQD